MHSLASSSWGDEERNAILKVMDSGQYTMGPKVAEFEKAYAEYVGTKYCVMVNSGSSANLLMVAAYTLRHGAGTVAVPALGWSTSYAPFQQYGWKMKFLDIDRETLNYRPVDLWEQCTNPDVDLILAVNILGSCNEFNAFPRKIQVLEDNCESMGAVYGGRKSGSFGVMASHSTFFSHHICTMEGGMVTTNDEHYYHMLLALRSHGWTRHLPEKNCLREKREAFRFVLPGYNVRPVEMSGAIGIEQLKKLPEIIKARRDNAESFPLKKQKEVGESSWYGFAVMADDVEELKAKLDERKIEHRPVVCGNFLRHPASHYFDYVAGPLPNADYVHEHGLMIGNHPKPIDWSVLSGI